MIVLKNYSKKMILKMSFVQKKEEGNFIKYAPRSPKLPKNAPFKSSLKNMFRPYFWPKQDKNTPKT